MATASSSCHPGPVNRQGRSAVAGSYTAATSGSASGPRPSWPRAPGAALGPGGCEWQHAGSIHGWASQCPQTRLYKPLMYTLYVEHPCRLTTCGSPPPQMGIMPHQLCNAEISCRCPHRRCMCQTTGSIQNQMMCLMAKPSTVLVQPRQLLNRFAELLHSDIAAHAAGHSRHRIWPQVQVLHAHTKQSDSAIIGT